MHNIYIYFIFSNFEWKLRNECYGKKGYKTYLERTMREKIEEKRKKVKCVKICKKKRSKN